MSAAPRPATVTLEVRLDGVRHLTPVWRQTLIRALVTRVRCLDNAVGDSAEAGWRFTASERGKGALLVIGTCQFVLVDAEVLRG